MPTPDIRFLLANERTFLAWQRTAVGLVAAALAVLHLVEPSPTMRVLAFVLLACSVLAVVGGWARHRRADRAIRAGEELSTNAMIDVFAAMVLVAVAVVVVSVVV